MKTLFVKQEDDFDIEDILISPDKFLEYYERDEINEFIEALKDLKLPDLNQYLDVIRKYKKLNLVNSINDATVEIIIKNRFLIQNAVNTVIHIKDIFTDKKFIWREIKSLADKMYDRNKDGILVTEEVKSLKNDALRIAEVNFRLKNLVLLRDRLDIFMVRLKQIEDEIKETLLYLQDIKSENSRVQTCIELALDTGELDRKYWKKEEN